MVCICLPCCAYEPSQEIDSGVEYSDYSGDWDCSEESFYTGNNACAKELEK